MDADGFTIVRGSGRRSKLKQARSQDIRGFRYSPPKPPGDEVGGVPTAVELHRRIATAATALLASQYWADCIDTLAGVIHGAPGENVGWRWQRPIGIIDGDQSDVVEAPPPDDGFAVHDIVCYGIGSLADSRNAREQLAFAAVLAEWLQIPGAVYMYDPVLGANEWDAAVRMGFTRTPVDEEGKRSVTVGTLFYMPRCGALLYNNVLWANWGPSLRNVAILGNSFAAYALRHPGRRLAGAVPYVHKILPHAAEHALPEQPSDSPFSMATLLTFPASSSLPSAFWDDAQEPPPLVDGIEI